MYLEPSQTSTKHTAKGHELFLQNISFVDVRFGSKYNSKAPTDFVNVLTQLKNVFPDHDVPIHQPHHLVE